jgi:hypothetical protein
MLVLRLTFKQLDLLQLQDRDPFFSLVSFTDPILLEENIPEIQISSWEESRVPGCPTEKMC